VGHCYAATGDVGTKISTILYTTQRPKKLANFLSIPIYSVFYTCAHLDAPLPAETLQRFHHHGAAKVVNDLWLLGKIGSRQGQAEATTTGTSSRRQHRVLCWRSQDLTAKEIATCP